MRFWSVSKERKSNLEISNYSKGTSVTRVTKLRNPPTIGQPMGERIINKRINKHER